MKNIRFYILLVAGVLLGSGCARKADKDAEAQKVKSEAMWSEPSATDQAETTAITTDSLGVMLTDTLSK